MFSLCYLSGFSLQRRQGLQAKLSVHYPNTTACVGKRTKATLGASCQEEPREVETSAAHFPCLLLQSSF